MRDERDGGCSGGAGMACVGGNIESESESKACEGACRRELHWYSKRAIILGAVGRRGGRGGGVRGPRKGSSCAVGGMVGDVFFVPALSSDCASVFSRRGISIL